MLVKDSRIKTDLTEESKLADYLAAYAGYGSFKGTFIADEPLDPQYSSKLYKINQQEVSAGKQINRGIENFVNKSNIVNKFHFGYTVLLGLGYQVYDENFVAGTTLYPEKSSQEYQNCLNAYKEYLRYYAQYYNPKMICFDYYVFDSECINGSLCSYWEYFENIKAVKEVAEEANLPFWACVQAGSNWNDGKTNMNASSTLNPGKQPTQAEMYWNVNTLLAFGAKGISYFPLVQPTYFAYGKDFDGDGVLDWNYDMNGLLGANGEPTVWYSRVKNTNKWIATVDEVLVNATNKRMLVEGNQAQEETGITSNLEDYAACKIKSIEQTNGVVIGHFDYQGKDAYYIVNYDRNDAQNITVTLDANKQYKLTKQLAAGETEVSDGQQKSITVDLIAGGAALIVIE